jgi:hypothetical protein
MNFAQCRLCAALMAAFLLLVVFSSPGQSQAAEDAAGPAYEPGKANRLANADFECGDGGYYEATNSRGETILLPNGWTLRDDGAVPFVSSARIAFEGKRGSCTTREKHVEKISGEDSLFVSSLDIETPPEPGKPFDVSIYQQVEAMTGTAYSLSGWMLTLCGGSNAEPKNDCPPDYYMAKLLGIDPTGGTDPDAPSVVWRENRNNFVDENNERIGWSNLYTSARAEGDKITIFARIDSPFRWHGNHGFIDALSLVEAPVAALEVATATVEGSAGLSVTLTWDGSIGPDIPTIPGGNYVLLYDVEYWHPLNGEWRDLQEGAEAPGSMQFAARCQDADYQFRVRARAEQPEDQEGSWPNQRYRGVWSDPISVPVPPGSEPQPLPEGLEHLYLPLLGGAASC